MTKARKCAREKKKEIKEKKKKEEKKISQKNGLANPHQ